MFGSFKLKSTIGRSNNVDLDDVLKTKQVLQSLGYYKPPKHGMNQYPDHDMFKSIERFQKKYGLNVDGVMRPDGETERALNHHLANLAPRRTNLAALEEPAMCSCSAGDDNPWPT